MSRAYDISPLASQVCGAPYLLTGKRRASRPHGTPDWILVYTLRGGGLYQSTDKTLPPFVSHPGLIVLFPPGTGHTMEADGGFFDHLWLHFLARAHWLDMMDWQPHPIGLRVRFLPAGPIRRKIVSLFREVIACTMDSASDREHFAMNALEKLLLWCARVKDAAVPHQNDRPTEICMNYLAANATQKMTLDSLAHISGQSVSRLTMMFRRQTGLSPIQYLEQIRLERAMELLTRTTIQIARIAEQVGFEDPFYFSQRFRKHTGYSPREFRNKTNVPTSILRRPNLVLNPNDSSLLHHDSSAKG